MSVDSLGAPVRVSSPEATIARLRKQLATVNAPIQARIDKIQHFVSDPITSAPGSQSRHDSAVAQIAKDTALINKNNADVAKQIAKIQNPTSVKLIQPVTVNGVVAPPEVQQMFAQPEVPFVQPYQSVPTFTEPKKNWFKRLLITLGFLDG